ncbi:RND superfamily putative drug exporter [Motilibacter rhizosphaerae]|uniref:RND superfamily putative drug exporter n=1 Tax=Motilibacter rhizosphaerae TaxID=598652 RepID=A0A4Q7NWG5_9ACTN|nr:MMPL family transporter [Motilibacter rhizosphaerae]RZS91524.1 RND superfamily putative drug exporter [Motilibacter rhizosphaerae]
MTISTPTRPVQTPPAGPRARRSRTTRVAAWSARHRWSAFLLWVLFVAAAVVLGGATGTRQLSSADSGTGQSGHMDRIVAATSFDEKPVENVLVTSRSGGRVGPAGPAAAADAAQRLRSLPQVAGVGTPVTSADGKAVLLPVTIAVRAGADADQAATAAEDALPALERAVAATQAEHRDVRVEQVGDASLPKAIDDRVAADFSKAEITSIPVTLVILVVVFGALVAASVPVLLALSSVMAALGISALVSHLLPVTPQLSSVVLLVGMAVGVDYSLFYVRREREERARGAARRDAIERAAETAGHAIVVSGLAVMVSMAGLFLAGAADFRSMGVGAVLVVAVAMTGSVTALPALLSLLGGALDKPRIPFLHKRFSRKLDSTHAGESRLWGAILRPVLRAPQKSALVAAGLLLVLAAPVLGMKLGSSGTESLPRSLPVMQTYDRLVASFHDTEQSMSVVVAADKGTTLDRGATTTALTDLAGKAAGRDAFRPSTGGPDIQFSHSGDAARLTLPLAVSASSGSAHDALTALRGDVGRSSLDAVPHSSWGVTGSTAQDVDWNDGMARSLPLVLLFVLGVTFLVLLVSFRAPVVALLSMGLNMLSVGAAYGLLVLVFQGHWAEGLLDFHGNGRIVSWLPLFAFVMLFGLSMDYTVLVVSRIREAHLAGVPAAEAVRLGITRTAGVVTSAAVIMVAVFSIFGTLSLLEFKQLGVGLAVAVLLDATVVRAVLLPATMAMLGERAWWTPRRGRLQTSGR